MEGGIPGSGGSGFDVFDFLNKRGGRSQGPRKAKSVLQVLEVSLKDVYNGIKKKLKITRDRVCKDCNGKGGKEDSITKCEACNGAGRVAKIVKLGFMVTQTISPCDECRGKGKIIKDKCKPCKGKGVIEEIKTLEIDIEKGVPEGHRYVFKGEADEYVRLYINCSLVLRQVMLSLKW